MICCFALPLIGFLDNRFSVCAINFGWPVLMACVQWLNPYESARAQEHVPEPD